MKKFWVMWTYSGNYSSLMEIEASSGREAGEKATKYFSADFHRRGNIYVFDRPPAYQIVSKEDYVIIDRQSDT